MHKLLASLRSTDLAVEGLVGMMGYPTVSFQRKAIKASRYFLATA